MYIIVPTDCHPMQSTPCLSEVQYRFMSLFPFWISPWIVKIFTNESILVLQLIFPTKLSFNWHFHNIKDAYCQVFLKPTSRNHIADSIFYRISLLQSWQAKLVILFQFWEENDQNHPIDILYADSFLLCKDMSSFTPDLQCPCHLPAYKKGTDSRTSLPKVRYIHFNL